MADFHKCVEEGTTSAMVTRNLADRWLLDSLPTCHCALAACVPRSVFQPIVSQSLLWWEYAPVAVRITVETVHWASTSHGRLTDFALVLFDVTWITPPGGLPACSIGYIGWTCAASSLTTVSHCASRVDRDSVSPPPSTIFDTRRAQAF